MLLQHEGSSLIWVETLQANGMTEQQIRRSWHRPRLTPDPCPAHLCHADPIHGLAMHLILRNLSPDTHVRLVGFSAGSYAALYIARILDMTGGITLIGRRLVVESVLIGGLASRGICSLPDVEVPFECFTSRLICFVE